MDSIIIDADNQVAGRLASLAAKELLKGRSVTIVNAEKAVVSGNPDYVFEAFKTKVDRGDPYHGPFYPRRPEQIIKRMVRGMLPKKPKGREALKRLKVHISVPEELSGKVVKMKASENTLRCKYVTLGSVSERLGVKRTW